VESQESLLYNAGNAKTSQLTDPFTTSISVGAMLTSVGAMLISGIVAWQTLFCHGSLKMTRPTLIVFSHDQISSTERRTIPKIFLRTLIYSTGKRGHVIENMFVNLLFENTRHPFHIWGYGDNNLVRGSGLFVGEEGVVFNHHFTQRANAPDFKFLQGEYQLEVLAAIVGQNKLRRLYSIPLSVSLEEEVGLQIPDCVYWFDWDPDKNRYSGHLEKQLGNIAGNLRRL
jgi:hypothetical protein